LRWKKVKLLFGLFVIVACAWLLNITANQNVTINWADVYQQIDGFGAASASDMPELNELTDARADMFFDPVKGIGLSLLRTQIQPDGSSLEIVTTKKAVIRGAKVWATPWSPPAAFKSNGALENGGYLIPADYSAWASVLAGYVKLMRSKGVPILAVSVQNEPDLSTTYASCVYTAQNVHDFVPQLYSAFQSAGIDTKIMIAEQYKWAFDLTEAAMADPGVAVHVDILAAHDYGNHHIVSYNSGRARLWETEASGASRGQKFDGSMRDGLEWASKIHQFMTAANVNAWHWWALMTDEDDNGGLTDKYGNPAKRMYVLGQWSKFVRPGWYRIGAPFSGRVQISAFKDPANGSFAIVAINSSEVSLSQKFSLRSFVTNSVTPWVTSASSSIAPQAAVPVNENEFAYRLPASSVTTFTGISQSPR